MLVPDEVGGQLSTMRGQWDKAAQRWPNHVTLFFGFPCATDKTVAVLQECARRSAPFRVRLKKVFANEGSKYFGIAVESGENPENKTLLAVRTAIGKAMKLPPEEDTKTAWQPHTTLGQCSQSEIEERLEQVRGEWEEVEFEARCLTVLEKDAKGRYKPVATVQLGQQ